MLGMAGVVECIIQCQDTLPPFLSSPATNTALLMAMSKAAAGPLKQKIGSP